MLECSVDRGGSEGIVDGGSGMGWPHNLLVQFKVVVVFGMDHEQLRLRIL